MTLEQSERMAPDRVFSLVRQCLHSWVQTDNGLIAQSPRQTTKHPDPLPQVRVLLMLVGHRIRTWNRSRQTTVNQSLQRAHGLPLQDGRDSSSSGTSVTQQKAPTLMRRGLRHVLVGHIVYELGTRGH